MVTIKVLAALGALMGLYIAAALQNGPEQTDANLCKLLRRAISHVPEQCVASLDSWGTVLVGLFVVGCVGLLLWDFREKVPLHKHGAAVARKMGPRVNSALLKLDPKRLITVGLIGVIIFAAVAVLGLILDRPKALSNDGSVASTAAKPDARITQLESEVRAKDDTIAVLQKQITAPMLNAR